MVFPVFCIQCKTVKATIHALPDRRSSRRIPNHEIGISGLMCFRLVIDYSRTHREEVRTESGWAP